MTPLDIEYLPYEKIVEAADRFLSEYNPKDEIPVPIEDIVELKLKIDIVPIPNLLKVFEIDGFILGDFTEIYVDEFIYKDRYPRYRFTLAHEVGHLFMHKEILSRVSFDPSHPIDSWKDFVDQLDKKDRNKLEFQGYSFGGLVLVPRRHLRGPFFGSLKEIQPMIKEAKGKGLTKEEYSDYAKEEIASLLAPSFEVSTSVVIKRIEFDKLEQHIP